MIALDTNVLLRYIGSYLDVRPSHGREPAVQGAPRLKKTHLPYLAANAIAEWRMARYVGNWIGGDP